MTRIEIPGGSYCDALWSGEWICTFWNDNGRVRTHLGDIPTQNGVKPGFVRCSDVGGFTFAGQANVGGDTIEYANGQWIHIAVVPCGVSPVIYLPDGTLKINVNCADGTNGYRYIDPYTQAVVTGDETYASDFGLSEWTYLGESLYIGQSNIQPGCGVYIGGQLRQLTTGYPCQFVRASKQGDQVSVAMIQLNGGPSLIMWATVAELAALPLAQAPAPTPEPVPVPIPTPTPEPVPPPVPIPAVNEGVVLMADIKGVLHHVGKNDLGKKHVSYNVPGSATGEVWSAQQDGSLQTRPKGSAGAFETFKEENGVTTANCFGTYNSYVPVDVTDL